MIYLFHGDDDFTIEETLASIKNGIGIDDLRDVNITEVEGESISIDELLAIASTVPFLADKRLVIIKGLLSRFERSKRGPQSNQQSPKLGPWDQLGDNLSKLPETTDVVFVETVISKSNPLFKIVDKVGSSRHFARPSSGQITRWINQRAQQSGIIIEPKATWALAEATGNNLRLIVSELEKLAVYCSGEAISPEHVVQLVSHRDNTSIFATVDSILEGRSEAAIRAVHNLMQQGTSAPYLMVMLTRQVRLLILAKELKNKGTPQIEIGKKLMLAGYPLRKTLDQEKKFTADRLVKTLHTLMKADLQIKSTGIDDGLIVDILVAKLSTT